MSSNQSSLFQGSQISTRPNFNKTMTEITIFKNEQFGEIRTMTDEQGETFFVGIDVAKALGYKNPSNALQVHVDKEDKTSYLIQVSGTKYEAKTIFLNESGLQLTKVRIEKTGNMVSTWNVTLLHRYNVTLSIFLYAKISIEGVIILLYIIYILYIIVL